MAAAGGGGGEEVSNKQVLARDYITSVPKESDMYLSSTTTKLELPEGSEAVLVKNLYLSCDPYMRGVKNPEPGRMTFFAPDSVRDSQITLLVLVISSVFSSF